MLVGGQGGDSEPPVIIGECPLLRQAIAYTDKAAHIQNINLHLIGESGTGKELMARRFHKSTRRQGRLVSVNCANFSEDLLEVALFGSEKGAYTGADREREGKLDAARGGTLFLDEIASATLRVQEKLLRVIQEKEFSRVGGQTTIKADVRIVSASNRELLKLCKEGRFREDLYYRLNVLPVRLPPLRDRGFDAVLIARNIMKRLPMAGSPTQTLDPSAEQFIMSYRWYGNIRELENILRRVGVITASEIVMASDLKQAISMDLPPSDVDIEQDHIIDIESIKRSIEELSQPNQLITHQPTSCPIVMATADHATEVSFQTDQPAVIAFSRSERQQLILVLLGRNSPMSAAQLRARIRISKSSMERDIRELMDAGYIQKVGTGKNIGYELASETIENRTDRRTRIGLQKWTPDFTTVLASTATPRSLAELMDILERKHRSKFRDAVIRPLMDAGLLRMTYPASPRSNRQKYVITPTGRCVLKEDF